MGFFGALAAPFKGVHKAVTGVGKGVGKAVGGAVRALPGGGPPGLGKLPGLGGSKGGGAAPGPGLGGIGGLTKGATTTAPADLSGEGGDLGRLGSAGGEISKPAPPTRRGSFFKSRAMSRGRR